MSNKWFTNQSSRRNSYPIRNRKKTNWSLVTWIIIINVGVFILMQGYNRYLATSENSPKTYPIMKSSLINYFALKPIEIAQGHYLTSIVLHMFTHIIAIHLLINMIALFSLGGLCEKIIGKKRFIWFYLISGIFAGLLSVFFSLSYGATALGEKIVGSPDIFMVGASGAIFAIAGLYVMLLPRLKFMIIFLPFFSIPAYIMVPAVLFITWIASIFGNLPVGNVAHFGGFLAGLVYGFYLKTKYRKKVMKLQRMFDR